MVKLHLLRAGYCIHPEFMTLKGGGFAPCRFPALCAVIEHSSIGVILFDTGYTERFHDETAAFPYSLYPAITPVHISSHETLRHQLQERNIAPEAVTTIILSHFHADHIAGLHDFPEAQIICSAPGYESIKQRYGWRALIRGFIPGLLPADISTRLRYVEHTGSLPLPAELSPFTEGYDLFGDGSILAILLPGHAEGHLGIYIPEHKTFLIADSCWSSTAYREFRLPHPLTYLFHHHRKAYQETLWKLHCLSKHNPALHLIPSHCQEWINHAG